MTHDWEARRDADHRALGEYFVEFSALVAVMETNMVRYLQGCGVQATVAHLPFGAMTADGIVSVFFDMAHLVYKHEEKEERVAKKLRGRVRDELPFRNDLAHGELMVGVMERKDSGQSTPIPPLLLRTKPGRSRGPLVTEKLDVAARTNSLLRLQTYVDLYASVCFRGNDRATIRDFIRIDAMGQLVDGPKFPGTRAE